MASVWVVETGSYSDYRVVGVYSSRELAERAAALATDAEVCEWPLDPWMDEINTGRSLWRVRMNYDGNAAKASQEGLPLSFADEDGETFYLTPYGPQWFGNPQYPIGGTVWATDAEHAIKIVNEKRLLAIANAPPPPPPEEPKTKEERDYERWQQLQAELKATAKPTT